MTHRKINEMGAKKQKQTKPQKTPYYPCLLLDHKQVANPALDYSVFYSVRKACIFSKSYTLKNESKCSVRLM